MNSLTSQFKRCFGLGVCLAIFTTGFLLSLMAQTVDENLPSLTCGQFSLVNSEHIPISHIPSSFVTADFNNDSVPDLAAPMEFTNSISITLGNPLTGFGASRDFNVGVSPREAVAGDFNRDGETDLAVTSFSDRRVNILLGDGEGNFSLGESYPTDGGPRKVEAADLNEDGWLDLVVANIDVPAIGLRAYFGGPNGFVRSTQPLMTVNGVPRSFRIADFNNDGNLDIISVGHNSSGNSFIVLFNGDGLGAFSASVTLTVPEVYAVDTGDFNGDGFVDFATPGYRDVNTRVYVNNQSGGFNAAVNVVLTSTNSVTITARDLNGDGKIDLFTGGMALINDGNANFTPRPTNNGTSGRLADFNGDGVLDMVTSGLVDQAASPWVFTLSVSYGIGDINFEAPRYLGVGGFATAVVAKDFNGDGRVDLASARPFSNSVYVSFQNADGTFTVPANPIYSNGGSQNFSSQLIAGDFNNDGDVDLVTNLNWATTLILLNNNGSGQFTQTSVNVGFQTRSFEFGDFNNDAFVDIVAVGQAYRILLNNGSGGFNLLPTVSISNPGTGIVAVGDYNGDNKLDFAIARGELPVNFYTGVGDGTFNLVGPSPIGAFATSIRGTDLNGDNLGDFVAVTGRPFNGQAILTILLANSGGGFTINTQAVPGSPTDIVVGDFNNDTFRDFFLVNSPSTFVTLYTGNGTGAMVPSSSVQTVSGAVSAAVADFNQDLKPDLLLAGQTFPTVLFINNTPTAPCLSVNDPTAPETPGTNAQFTVTMSAAAVQSVFINYRVVGRSATQGHDFSGIASGTIEFLPGDLTKTIDVPVLGDVKDEIDENFELVLSNPVNASLIDNIGIATIIDDDAAPSVSAADATVSEGTGANLVNLIFNVSLAAPTGRKSKVRYSLLNDTAEGGSDFSATSGTVVFEPDESLKQIAVEINPDAFVEGDETFRLKFADPINLVVSDDEAIGTILNDDIGGTVQFSATGFSAAESDDSVVVTVNRADGAAAGVVIAYSTANGTATENQDYLRSSGKLIFGAGETSKTFIVPILDDAIDEPGVETVTLSLQTVTGGGILGTQSVSTLNLSDDDATPSLAIANTSVTEGNTGSVLAEIEVRLMAVSGQTISVGFATADGTATAPADYVGTAGTLTFLPGEIVKTIVVPVNGDLLREPAETFLVNLSSPVNVLLQNSQSTATIIDNDVALRRARTDFDGDNKTDISIFRPSVGEWWYSRSSDSQVPAVQFGNSTDKLVTDDFTGDGKSDIAFWRPATGEWFILRSEDGTYFSLPFGSTGDIPAPGDYDGDGKADAAVFRPSGGTWFIQYSSGIPVGIVQFGSSEDKPVAEDYDGDGKADIAIFRPSDGSWWYLRSSDSQFRVFSFGLGTDRTVPGDYTGDGTADIAVFRPSTGEWFVQRSEDGSYFSFPFGTAGDVAAPGDYDGDGKTDAAVFRPSVVTWFVNRTTAGVLIAGFGSTGDVPVPGSQIQ